MRMFLYYAVHSVLNQLKKIFKTWVMVFIGICFLFGIGIGLLFAGLEDLSEKQKEAAGIEEVQETQKEEAELPEEEQKNVIADTIGYSNFIELIAGAVVLISFTLSILNAEKNAGRIFLPADVTLLFPAPLKPQSVMLFRIATQFGQMIFVNIYLLFQLPNLVLNAGLSLWGALMILLAFGLMSFCGTLFQLLFYLLGSMLPTFKRLMRPIVYGILMATASGFMLYQKVTGLEMLEAASGFFNAKLSRFIPFWGWLKGMCRFAIDGDVSGTILSIAALVIGMVVLILVIWNLKVDFYEDAMTKAEEIAEVMERAQSENPSMARRRKKDRSDKLRRDGMKHGWGANAFFFKAMYNRFRFAHFGFFTKTMETYLVAACAVALFTKISLESDSTLLLAAGLAVFVFFRSLGNPLEADTKMQYFILIPESTWMKLFYSLMAGTVNAALDLLPPLIVGAVILGANPLTTLLWVFPILSIDIYSTTVGVFIGLSVPTSAGKTIKQMVQILFVYFGLLPDIVILAVAFTLGSLPIGVIGAVLLNLLLGGFFFWLSPYFLDPVGKKTRKAGEEIFLN